MISAEISTIWRYQATEKIKRLPRKLKTLEVGCGSAPYSELFKDYTGCDIDGGRFPKKGKFAVCDARDMKFKDNEFEFILCYALLEHVAEPERIVSEMHRVLKKGGRAFLTCTARTGSYFEVYPVLNKYSGKGFKKLVEAPGFRVEEFGTLCGGSIAYLFELVDFTIFKLLLKFAPSLVPKKIRDQFKLERLSKQELKREYGGVMGARADLVKILYRIESKIPTLVPVTYYAVVVK
ncbi:MAG: class I SAM-dependent methyltransferase [archaeon]